MSGTHRRFSAFARREGTARALLASPRRSLIAGERSHQLTVRRLYRNSTPITPSAQPRVAWPAVRTSVQ